MEPVVSKEKTISMGPPGGRGTAEGGMLVGPILMVAVSGIGKLGYI